MLELPDIVRAEQASDEPKCGHTCRCHGNYVCVRTVHDHHGNHWVKPDGTIEIAPPGPYEPITPGEGWTYKPESRVVHAAWQANGELVTWCGPHLTDEQIDRNEAEAKAAHAAWLQSIRDELDTAHAWDNHDD